MWHSIWNGVTWKNPEPVVSGPQKRDVEGGDGFDPRSARAVISNGNVALVTWGTDGAAGSNGAWYSYERLNAPELSMVPLPLPSPLPQIDLTNIPATATDMLSADQQPTPALTMAEKSPSSYLSPQLSLLIGVVPVLLVLIGIIVVKALLRSKA